MSDSDAYDQGYRDGLYTGANDARRGQSYNPQRSHFFKRSGAYQQAYQAGFMRGYDEGYQNYQKYFTNWQFHP